MLRSTTMSIMTLTSEPLAASEAPAPLAFDIPTLSRISTSDQHRGTRGAQYDPRTCKTFGLSSPRNPRPAAPKVTIEGGNIVTPLASGRPASLIQHAATVIATSIGAPGTDAADEDESLVNDTFYITDLGATERLFKHLDSAMPRVTPHYAVKCFPEPMVMATLAKCGAGFDCASREELRLVMSLGVDPSRVIFANPCKRVCDLMAIKKHKVPYTTFDSLFELQKIADRCPEVGCVLRIRADDPTARMPFGVKYGSLPSETAELLQGAKDLGLSVRGVSFHVGSGAGNPEAFRVAILAAKAVLDHVRLLDPTAFDAQKALLDLGGGLSGGFDEQTGNAFVYVGGKEVENRDVVARAVNSALEETFSAEIVARDFKGGFKVISEPGRYFAESSSSLVTRVIGKRLRCSIGHFVTSIVDLPSLVIDETKLTPIDAPETGPGAGGAAAASARVVDNSFDSGLGPAASFEALASPEAAVSPQGAAEAGTGAAEPADPVAAAAAEAAASGAAPPIVVEALAKAGQGPPGGNASGEVHYYMSDGIYGAFNAIIYDGWVPKGTPFRLSQGPTATPVTDLSTLPATIFGPTCDSLDMVFSRLPDCPLLEIGDWVLFPNCGAYTMAGATDFNGIPATAHGGVRTFYVRSDDFTSTSADAALPIIFSEKPPMNVMKNF